jgi:ribosomal protein S27AE
MTEPLLEECWRCHAPVESEDECLALAEGKYRLVCGKCSDAMWPDEPEGRFDSQEMEKR